MRAEGIARAFELADHARGQAGTVGDVLDREACTLAKEPHGLAETLVDRLIAY